LDFFGTLLDNKVSTDTAWQVVTSGQFPVTTSLAEYLRYHLGLTGTKIGCGEVSRNKSP
jgi:xanthine dehydrogenase iron-sulfur cluster and FAD-binding subunit A